MAEQSTTSFMAKLTKTLKTAAFVLAGFVVSNIAIGQAKNLAPAGMISDYGVPTLVAGASIYGHTAVSKSYQKSLLLGSGLAAVRDLVQSGVSQLNLPGVEFISQGLGSIDNNSYLRLAAPSFPVMDYDFEDAPFEDAPAITSGSSFRIA